MQAGATEATAEIDGEPRTVLRAVEGLPGVRRVSASVRLKRRRPTRVSPDDWYFGAVTTDGSPQVDGSLSKLADRLAPEEVDEVRAAVAGVTHWLNGDAGPAFDDLLPNARARVSVAGDADVLVRALASPTFDLTRLDGLAVRTCYLQGTPRAPGWRDLATLHSVADAETLLLDVSPDTWQFIPTAHQASLRALEQAVTDLFQRRHETMRRRLPELARQALGDAAGDAWVAETVTRYPRAVSRLDALDGPGVWLRALQELRLEERESLKR